MPTPYIDIKRAKKAHELRKAGLSIREIARAIPAHHETVMGWLKIDVRELSTTGLLRRSGEGGKLVVR